jgi:hypothetical protein
MTKCREVGGKVKGDVWISWSEMGGFVVGRWVAKCREMGG